MSDQKRPYRKKRRAQLEEETRRRITESAVELHGSVGPARTSMSAVAERAGVRRSTLYRHFADEGALFEACSAHWAAANPPPDLSAWAEVEDPDERLRTALADRYRIDRELGRGGWLRSTWPTTSGTTGPSPSRSYTPSWPPLSGRSASFARSG